MPEINLSELYADMQQEMLTKLISGAHAVRHAGSKGDNTEANWIEWFQSYLPKRYKVDKAIIIDSTGKESDQMDLVIYDAQYSYLVFHQGDTKLIPAESVYAPHRQRLLWPVQRGGAAFIAAHVTNSAGVSIEYTNNGAPLEKGCSLHFRAITGIKPPYIVKWQIVNTGYEARTAGCLRGYFEDSDEGSNGKRESTSYAGSHSVQCFIIKRGICVARSKEFIVNIQ